MCASQKTIRLIICNNPDRSLMVDVAICMLAHKTCFRPCNLCFSELKLLMELYKQMTAEKATITKWKITPNSNESGVGLKPQEQLQETADQSQPGQVFAKPSEKQQAEHSENQGTHIVGGSAFGWNFITFPGSKPIYYGRTKELFRAARVTL